MFKTLRSLLLRKQSIKYMKKLLKYNDSFANLRFQRTRKEL